jgi:hypothetical protein
MFSRPVLQTSAVVYTLFFQLASAFFVSNFHGYPVLAVEHGDFFCAVASFTAVPMFDRCFALLHSVRNS